MKKLNCVLLVDDSEANNYFSQMILEDMGVVESIAVAKNGIEALEYLQVLCREGAPIPALILLDINMPKMDGWEFLLEYDKLEEDLKAKVVVVMLTTSLSPFDLEKAKDNPTITEFRNKPLSKEVMTEILRAHFGF